MSSFQIELGRMWQDYSKEEDKILKRAYMAGFPSARFQLRGQEYEYNFSKMVQINKSTRRERAIRPPLKKDKRGRPTDKPWDRPAAPIVPAGQTTVINVPPGAPGTTIQVPYPGHLDKLISVNVPASAKVGQAMLVPVPKLGEVGVVDAPKAPSGGGGMSAGGKILTGGAVLVGVGGAAVGGAILGEHIAEHGLDATVDAVGDGLEDVGEAIGDFAVDAGEFLVDAGEDVGDFIMDLF
jgi:hypothetical protein